MTPNQSHVAKWKAEQSPDAGWIVTDGNGNNWEEGGCTLAFLDEGKAEGFAYGLTSAQAKSAPAEPVSREVVEYQQLSRWGCWDRIEKDVFDLGVLGHTPERFRALYTAPPSPDAELVALLRDARTSVVGSSSTSAWFGDLLTRIDAKLASLKGEDAACKD